MKSFTGLNFENNESKIWIHPMAYKPFNIKLIDNISYMVYNKGKGEMEKI